MGEQRDSVVINAPPERVWDWLTGLADHYRAWHPDHVSAHWIQGPPNTVGSVLRAVEHLGGRREVLRFQLTAIDPPHEFRYRLRGLISLLLPRGSFSIEPAEGGCRFTAGLAYRFGSVTERLLRRHLVILRQHMREEGDNLKRLIEATG